MYNLQEYVSFFQEINMHELYNMDNYFCPDRIYVINMEKDELRMAQFCKNTENQFFYKRIQGVDALQEPHATKYKNWVESINIKDMSYEQFDWGYYLDKYPDLKEVGIEDKEQAWLHWHEYGEKELRSCNPNNNIRNMGQWGCLQSHIHVLRDAIQNDYDHIVILEDDIILRDSWKNIMAKVGYFQKYHSLIYLGCSQHCWNNIDYENGFYYANQSMGTFAYYVKKDFFYVLLYAFEQQRKPVDQYLVSIQQTFPEKCIVLFPNKVICDLEDSNIGEKRSN